MRRRRVTFSEESIEATVIPTKGSIPLKDAEKLRKKLKTLLENQRGGEVIVSSTWQTRSVPLSKTDQTNWIKKTLNRKVATIAPPSGISKGSSRNKERRMNTQHKMKKTTAKILKKRSITKLYKLRLKPPQNESDKNEQPALQMVRYVRVGKGATKIKKGKLDKNPPKATTKNDCEEKLAEETKSRKSTLKQPNSTTDIKSAEERLLASSTSSVLFKRGEVEGGEIQSKESLRRTSKMSRSDDGLMEHIVSNPLKRKLPNSDDELKERVASASKPSTVALNHNNKSSPQKNTNVKEHHVATEKEGKIKAVRNSGSRLLNTGTHKPTKRGSAVQQDTISKASKIQLQNSSSKHHLATGLHKTTSTEKGGRRKVKQHHFETIRCIPDSEFYQFPKLPSRKVVHKIESESGTSNETTIMEPRTKQRLHESVSRLDVRVLPPRRDYSQSDIMTNGRLTVNIPKVKHIPRSKVIPLKLASENYLKETYAGKEHSSHTKRNKTINSGFRKTFDSGSRRTSDSGSRSESDNIDKLQSESKATKSRQNLHAKVNVSNSASENHIQETDNENKNSTNMKKPQAHDSESDNERQEILRNLLGLPEFDHFSSGLDAAIKVSKLPPKQSVHKSKSKNVKGTERLLRTSEPSTSRLLLHHNQSKPVTDAANQISSNTGESIQLKAHKRHVNRDASKKDSSADKEIQVNIWNTNTGPEGNVHETIPKQTPRRQLTEPPTSHKNRLIKKDLAQDISNIKTNDTTSKSALRHTKEDCKSESYFDRYLNYDFNDYNSDYSDSDDFDYDSNDFDFFSSSDTTDYETDSSCTHSSHNMDVVGDLAADFGSDSDPTYELPEDVPEDVYIASGTAVKHDLPEDSEITFDSDKKFAQIIELLSKFEGQKTDKTSEQGNMNGPPKKEVHNDNADDRGEESDSSCPKLVPITEDNINSLEYESDSYSESTTSSDSLSDYSLDEHDIVAEKPQMKAEIFQANCANKQDIPIRLLQTATEPIENHSTRASINEIATFQANTTNCKVITTNNEIIHKLSDDLTNSTAHLDHIVAQSDSDVDSDPIEAQTIPIVDNIENKQTSDSMVNDSESDVPSAESTGENVFFNAVNSNHVLVLLRAPLYIYGTVKVSLFTGSVNIFGYHPKINEVLEVFSPQGYSSLKIEPARSSELKRPSPTRNILSLTNDFFLTDLEMINKQYNSKTDAILILERNDNSKKVNMLRKFMAENLFPYTNGIETGRPNYTSEFVLQCMLSARADKPLITAPTWRNIALRNNNKMMVTGGKSVGKSTLVRYLVNRHLNVNRRVLLIDLDIGQPEIFVPQTVSATTLNAPLLGPGYLLNKEPDKAYLVGQVNVVLLPQQYIRSVEALIKYCNERAEYKNIPWIVNTMGYNKGFGDELIAFICNLMHPTNIIQLHSDMDINNFDLILNKENVNSLELNITGSMFEGNEESRSQHELTLLSSVIPGESKYQRDNELKPRDIRLAMIICRLSRILTGHADWITDVKPVCASLDDLKIRSIDDDRICTDDLIKTLVGNLVYLCNDQSGQTLECKGIGIVRAIDNYLNLIHLLPAVSVEELKDVNCLVVCGIPLPSSILINQGPKVKGIASYVFSTINQVASMYIKQMYSRPQQFLSGRHKPIME